MTPFRARTLANWLNLSTPFGLLVALLGGARLKTGPRGLRHAEGYRLDFPLPSAFTIGNVIVMKTTATELEARCPGTLAHEERHASQWAYCGGLPFLSAYIATMGWSWLRTGDRGAACWFEQEAGLATGGYLEKPRRPLRQGFAALGDVLRRR